MLLCRGLEGNDIQSEEKGGRSSGKGFEIGGGYISSPGPGGLYLGLGGPFSWYKGGDISLLSDCMGEEGLGGEGDGVEEGEGEEVVKGGGVEGFDMGILSPYMLASSCIEGVEDISEGCTVCKTCVRL